MPRTPRPTLLRHALLAQVLPALSLFAAAAHAFDATPLLDYALSQQFEPASREIDFLRQVKARQAALERNPPPAENCSQTLGASRFAAMYDDLGQALDGAGNYDGAAQAYRRALECTPRAAYLRPLLATDLLYLDRYDEARATAEQGLTADETDLGLNAVLAELDFAEQRWNDAIPRLRQVATDSEDEIFAGYIQCLLWLAQRASGTTDPKLVSRDAPEEWPRPILEALRGEADESDVVKIIEEEKNGGRRREILAEALYYLGQRRLVEGDADSGRRYLAATVNLKVHYFLEHHLARAALTRLGANKEPVPLMR